LLDVLYGSGRPDDHKRLGGPKDINGLGKLEKPDESIELNNSENLDDPEDSNGPGRPEDPNMSRGLEDLNGLGGPEDPNGSA